MTASMNEGQRATLEAIERIREDGVAQAKQGNYGTAAERFSAALEFLPDDYKLHLDRGFALFYAKRYEEALQDAEKALCVPF
jgi:Flp pilus assembly protein TadD